MHLQYNNDHHQSAGIEHAVALAVQISNKEISTALRLAANCSMATIDEQKDNDSKGLDTVVRREAKDTGLLPDVAPKNESQVVEMERSMSTRIEFAPAQISTLLNSNASSTDITSEQHFDAQSTTIPVTLSNFELFPDLPTELRLRIWRFAGLVPQLVTLIDDGKNRRYLCGVQKNGLLFVNKEANEEVIKVRYVELLAPHSSKCVILFGAMADPHDLDPTTTLDRVEPQSSTSTRKLIAFTFLAMPLIAKSGIHSIP